METCSGQAVVNNFGRIFTAQLVACSSVDNTKIYDAELYPDHGNVASFNLTCMSIDGAMTIASAVIALSSMALALNARHSGPSLPRHDVIHADEALVSQAM